MKSLKTRSQFTKYFKLIIFALVIISLVFLRLSSWVEKTSRDPTTFTATLLEEPKVYLGYQYFSINGFKIKTSSKEIYKYGDRLKISGSISGGKLSLSQIKKVGQSTIDKWLYSIRKNLREAIFKALPQPESGLLVGILIGLKEDLPKWFSENLQKTGTIHVVVVSGYNISIVAGIFASSIKFVGRKWSIILSLLAIIFYTFLVGANPPAVRAAIMAGFAFTGLFLGKQRISFYFLFLAGLLMFLINPSVLSEIGFQLSFLATAGILAFQKKIFGFCKFLPTQLREDFSTSLAAQILVYPIIFYHFGSVSAISPLANAAVLWIVPIATIIGFIFLIVSFIFWPLALAISWVVWALLHTFVFLIDVFARLNFTYLVFKQGQICPVLFYYSVLSSIIGCLLLFRKAK